MIQRLQALVQNCMRILQTIPLKNEYQTKNPETEFKGFERLLKFKKPRLKYDWFRLQLYLIYQDLSRHSIETGSWRI